MSEHPKIEFTRRVCRERKLRYKIQNDALFLYIPQMGHYIQTCFNLLNFSNNEAILDHIEGQITQYNL